MSTLATAEASPRQATPPDPEPAGDPEPAQAAVWIDHESAILVQPTGPGSPRVTVVDRGPHEGEAAFGARAAHEIGDRGRVLVTGPLAARTAFEREYVALTHRPDRIVDVEPERIAPGESLTADPS